MVATYRQVHDVLNGAVEFHRELEGFYGQLAQKADRKRVQLLLRYMSRHQRDFERGLAKNDDEGMRGLLDTWMQYTPSDQALTIPESDTLHRSITVDEVVELALLLDQRLLDFYLEAARLAKSPEVRDPFRKLARQQQDDKEKLQVNAVLIKHT